MDPITAAQMGANEGNAVWRLHIELIGNTRVVLYGQSHGCKSIFYTWSRFLHSGRFLVRTGGIYLTVQISLIEHVCVNVCVCICVCVGCYLYGMIINPQVEE